MSIEFVRTALLLQQVNNLLRSRLLMRLTVSEARLPFPQRGQLLCRIAVAKDPPLVAFHAATFSLSPRNCR